MTDTLDNGPPTPDGIPLKDWIAASPVGRTTAYQLLDALGLNPGKAVFPGYPKAVPFLSPDQRAAMDAAALAVRNGRSVASIAAETAAASGEIAPAPRQTLAGAAAEVQGEQGEARLAAGAQAFADAGGLAAVIAAAIAHALPQQPAPEPDPLLIAERLAAAATAGHWLTTAELAELLGCESRTAPDPVRWVERFPRPGYRVETTKHGRGRFWRLSFDGPAPTPARTLAAADRPPVGFGASLLEASRATVQAQAVTLERLVPAAGPQLPPIPRPWG
jgi:hypothetical protein